jgi:hypothetical protein
MSRPEYSDRFRDMGSPDDGQSVFLVIGISIIFQDCPDNWVEKREERNALKIPVTPMLHGVR